MIKSLQIRNYAIIDSLEIEFAEGLTIITGETGAGKSILLGALGLIMGERADTRSLYNESEKCVIEARFDISAYDLHAFFQEHQFDFDPELIIRREIVPSGKSRGFINDSPATINILQDLSKVLVDLHQQFDALDIHNQRFQLRLLDAMAGNLPDLKSYQREFQEYAAKKRRLSELKASSENAAKDLEYLQFQLEEFSTAELAEGEQESLEEELSRLNNAEEIKRVTAGAFQLLSENEQSVLNQLQEVGVNLHQMGRVDPQVGQLSDRLQGILAELQDLSAELENVAEATEYDEERIQIVQERLDLIYRLQKKHGVPTVAELLRIQAELQERIGDFEDLSGNIERLEAELATFEGQLREQAATLRQRRHGVAPEFSSRVVESLSTLAMPASRLEVDFRETDSLTEVGLDEVEFLFTANKGSRPQPIRDVASGGELSRLTLVTKSLVARSMALPTLVFDEIDAGVSGDVALKMGNILDRLSEHHQVVVITHSPQVASRADVHYYVYKSDEDERTTTKIRKLAQDERIRAIAIMLSQSPPSDSALENARELMQIAQ